MLKGCSASVMVFWAVLFALCIFSFDRAMRIDADNLCTRGDTGFSQCN